MAKSSRLVPPETRTVAQYGNTEAIVSSRYSLIEPSDSERMLMFTTITPPGFRCSRTSVKNSTLDIWKGIVMSW